MFSCQSNLKNEKSYILPASKAQTYGPYIRYEEQEHKNVIGFWRTKKDWCEWKLSNLKKGTYEISVYQGSKNKNARMNLFVLGKNYQKSFEFSVVYTGHFQKFTWVKVGKIFIREKGTYKIQVKPLSGKGAFLDIRKLKLLKVLSE